MDPLLVVFFALAVFLVWRLRSVLGQRHPDEQRPTSEMPPRRDPIGSSPEDDKVVAFPPRGEPGRAPAETFRWAGVAQPASDVARGLDAIAAADRNFDGRAFVSGARQAYEMIVNAFAAGDRRTLEGLLSREVFQGFDAAITERERRGDRVDSTFVSIDKADIVEAQLRDRQAQITMRFVSQLITATRDRQGQVIDGNPDRVSEITDVWTFSRDTSRSDPTWLLVATEAAQ